MNANNVMQEAESASSGIEGALDVQVQGIESQLAQLRQDAAELDRAAARMLQESSDDCDLIGEASQASAQAGDLRNVAAHVEQQLAAAPTDKRGNKKISGATLGNIQSRLSTALHDGENELADTHHRIQEAGEINHAHKVVKAEASKPSKACTPSRATRREAPPVRVTVVRTPEPTVVERAQHAGASAMAYLSARAEEAREAAAQTWETITHSSVVQGSMSAIRTGSAAVVAFVSQPLEIIGNAAETVSAKVSEVASTVKQTAVHAVDRAVETKNRAVAAVSETANAFMDGAREKARTLAKNLGFGAGDAPTVTAKSDEAAKKAALAKAQAQARAVATPSARSGMETALASLGALLPASLPRLPVIEWDLPSLF